MDSSRMMDVALEAFLTRLLPVFHEVTLQASRNFQPETYPPLAVVAGVAALAASFLLWRLGVWLRRMPAKVSSESQQARIEGMRKGAQEWLPWLLILSPTPFGGMLIVASGFFEIRPLVVALAVIAAEVLWRVSPML